MYQDVKKEKQGYTFRCVHNDGTTVKMTLNSDSTTDEHCEAFAQFLRGCGYTISGTIEIVEESSDAFFKSLEDGPVDEYCPEPEEAKVDEDDERQYSKPKAKRGKKK